MSKILEIPLMETTINGNGRIYFHISENIKRIEFISNEFYQNIEILIIYYIKKSSLKLKR